MKRIYCATKNIRKIKNVHLLTELFHDNLAVDALVPELGVHD
jgi:hypothetical protein